MNKALRLAMALHQGLSFSGLFMKIPKAEAVFWPGCALLNLDGTILKSTLHILRRADGGVQLACGCCSQPSLYLFPKRAEKRREKLIRLLKRQGVKRIYTACPNCTLQLRQLEGFRILPIWEVLAAHIEKEDIVPQEETFIWHDPCPSRGEALQQEAFRVLLSQSGCDCVFPAHSGKDSRCCGNFHMMAVTNPEKSRMMRQNRLSEFPQSRIIASSCEGCLGAFRREGRKTRHLLEILFGQSRRRSWLNRFKNSLK